MTEPSQDVREEVSYRDSAPAREAMMSGNAIRTNLLTEVLCILKKKSPFMNNVMAFLPCSDGRSVLVSTSRQGPCPWRP